MDDVSPDAEMLQRLYSYYKYPGDFSLDDVKKLFAADFEEKVLEMK